VEVDLDFIAPFELKVDLATHCKKYHFPHFTCLRVCVAHLEVNPTMDTSAVALAFSACPPNFSLAIKRHCVSKIHELQGVLYKFKI
jgi:hypothetical protein